MVTLHAFIVSYDSTQHWRMWWEARGSGRGNFLLYFSLSEHFSFKSTKFGLEIFHFGEFCGEHPLSFFSRNIAFQFKLLGSAFYFKGSEAPF